MAEISARIKPKKSSTASEVPLAADLEVAEIAVNTADGKLFVKHTDNSIKEISGGGTDITTESIDALSDVDTTTSAPTDGQVLTWVNANSQWEPADTAISNAVDSVNGQTGVVDLGVEDMNDVAYPIIPSSIGLGVMIGIGNTPTNPGEYVAHSGNSSIVYSDDAAGNVFVEMAKLQIGDSVDLIFGGGTTLTHNVQIAQSTNTATSNFISLDAQVSYTPANGETLIITSSRFSTSATGQPSDGQVLTWVGANSQWEAVDAAGAAAIDELTDVDTSTTAPTDGQVLTWVNANSQWEPVDTATNGAVDSVNGQTGAVSLDVYDMTNVSLVAGGASDPNFSQTPLLLHMDGVQNSTTFTNSGNTNLGAPTVTNAYLDQTDPKFGSAAMVANGGYVDFPFNDALNFNGGDFTIESWLQFAGPLSNRTLVAFGNTDSDYAYTFYFTSSTGVFLETTDSSTVTSYVFSWTPSVDTWYHVALCRDGSNLRMFVDGTQVDVTRTITNTIYTETDGVLRVGASLGGSVNWLGYIDELRVTVGHARYTTNFTAPTAAFPEGEAFLPPTNGQVLTWVDTNTQWEPRDLRTAAETRTLLGIGEYVDDAAAGTGGVASGALYYNTTTSDYRLKS